MLPLRLSTAEYVLICLPLYFISPLDIAALPHATLDYAAYAAADATVFAA